MKDFKIDIWDLFPDGKWHHLVIVRDGEKVSYYLDGEFRQDNGEK